MYAGAAHADTGEYRACVRLWNYALSLKIMKVTSEYVMRGMLLCYYPGDAAELRHQLHGEGGDPALHEHPAQADRDRAARGGAPVLGCADHYQVSPEHVWDGGGGQFKLSSTSQAKSYCHDS